MQADSLAMKDGRVIASAHHQASSGLPIASSGLPMDPLSRAAIQGQQLQQSQLNQLPPLQIQSQQHQHHQRQQQQHQQRDAHSKCTSVRCTPPQSPVPTAAKCHENVSYTTKNFQQDQLQQQTLLQQQQMTLQQQQQLLLQQQQQQQTVQQTKQTESKSKKCHEEVTHRERKPSHGHGKKCHEHVVTTTKNFDQTVIRQQLLQTQQNEMQMLLE